MNTPPRQRRWWPGPRMDVSQICGCAVIVATLAGTGCEKHPFRPGTGEFQGVLISPNQDEGAAVIELRGSVVSDVTVAGGRAFLQQDGNTARAIIILDDPGVINMHVTFEDVRGDFRATVLEVADASNQIRGSLSGYKVRFRP